MNQKSQSFLRPRVPVSKRAGKGHATPALTVSFLWSWPSRVPGFAVAHGQHAKTARLEALSLLLLTVFA